MAKNRQEVQKQWFSDGPAMAYPARQRTFFWLINLILYALLNMFYLRIQSGFWTPWHDQAVPKLLIDQLLAPLNIFHFPTQIITIALIMGLLCTVPLLTAQLFNLLHAVPFILAALVLGQNQVLSLCLFVSCAAVSFEHLRFKSKFVAAILCLLPMPLYWVLFSGPNPAQDPLRWAVLYAPWGMAFLTCLIIIGVVILIGHFVRYRPGILTPVFGLTLAGTVLLFHSTVGMHERDFQAQVAQYSPAQIPAFRHRSITAMLEKELAHRLEKEPFLEPETVKQDLRRNWRQTFLGMFLASRLDYPLGIDSSTPSGSELFKFDQARKDAIQHLDAFIARSDPKDKRVADALYYRALLIDLTVDLRALRDEDFLRYSHDIPSLQSENYWKLILDRYPETDVSIEARWRLARLWAAAKPQKPSGPFRFDEALTLLEQAWRRSDELLQARKHNPAQDRYAEGFLGDIFRRPPPALTNEQLTSLQMRIGRLMTLLAEENRKGPSPRSQERLAEFVALDPRHLNYEARLTELGLDSPTPDPLMDNIQLAQAMLIKDIDARIERLTDLTVRYEDRDGGLEAMLELAQLLMEKYRRSDFVGDRDVLRSHSAQLLQKVAASRPEGFLGWHAQKLLNELPPVK